MTPESAARPGSRYHCGLPEWFGRNLDAWADTIRTRGISEVIDRHDVLVIHGDKGGVFASRNLGARSLGRCFAGRQNRLVVHQPL
ncbi:barstar family protein [Streptomyces sp. NPDC002580]|uniref:barstar family protein n=1 Tax=Streptomyces sp. NPDC002580 TaxID=3364653 RepID=UPI0036AAE0D7